MRALETGGAFSLTLALTLTHCLALTLALTLSFTLTLSYSFLFRGRSHRSCPGARTFGIDTSRNLYAVRTQLEKLTFIVSMLPPSR